jgi:two-component system chemotaxis response regulator CheV
METINTQITDLRAEANGSFDESVGLVGTNRMEILLFSVGSRECFGINVFKVKEVTHAARIAKTPYMPRGVDGIVSLRGHVLPVLNLASFLGIGNPQDQKVMMITEYSRNVLGFLVQSVDRIVRVDWDKVHAPETLSGEGNKLITAITELQDGQLVSILDVEEILTLAFGEAVTGNVEKVENAEDMTVFFVDDSSVARKKISEVLGKMGVKHIQAHNGLEALQRLKNMADFASKAGEDMRNQVRVIMVDAEMPEMDGYVLTKNIKADKRFEHIPVVMHSSLSSAANRNMGKQAGVDHYVSKFDATVLAETLRPLLMP